MDVCVSDEVRSDVLAEEYKARGLITERLSQDEVYKIEVEAGQKTKDELNKRIGAKLHALSQAGTTHNIFILDKNHCAPNLIDFVNKQAEIHFQGADIRREIMVPDIISQDDAKAMGPFKFDTVLIGLVRSLNRTGHVTMKYGNIHTLLSFIGCLGNQIIDRFDEKFPPNVYRRIQVDYYNQKVVEEFKAAMEHPEQVGRLRQVLLDLAHKKASVTDHADFIAAVTKSMVPMNVFPEFDDKSAKKFIQNILDA